MLLLLEYDFLLYRDVGTTMTTIVLLVIMFNLIFIF